MAGGSKNNIANRGAKARVRTHNGKEVVPVKVSGFKVPTIMGAIYRDSKQLVVDSNDKPIPYKNLN